MKSQTFEQSLRAAVRRLSRRNFEDQIREVADHYQDLCLEGIEAGLSKSDAQEKAIERLGSVKDIARQIVQASKRTQGFRLQWMGVGLWLFGTFLPLAMEQNGYDVGSLWGKLVQASISFGLMTTYLGGFLAALGILRASRAVIPAYCIGLILIPLGQVGFLLSTYKSFERYERSLKRHTASWNNYSMTEGPKIRERLNFFEVAITEKGDLADSAIQKISSTVHRPQDRGVVITEPITGKWIYPTSMMKVRDNNLTWVYFASTDSLELARRRWQVSDVLLKALPTMRKGTEAELAHTASIRYYSPSEVIRTASWQCTIPFLYSFLASLFAIGIGLGARKTVRQNRPVS